MIDIEDRGAKRRNENNGKIHAEGVQSVTKLNNLHWPVQLPLLSSSGHLLACLLGKSLNCRLQIVTSLITGGALEFSFSLLVVEMTCEHSVWGERHTKFYSDSQL